jgi:hypothetical protein
MKFIHVMNSKRSGRCTSLAPPAGSDPFPVVLAHSVDAELGSRVSGWAMGPARPWGWLARHKSFARQVILAYILATGVPAAPVFPLQPEPGPVQ